MCLSNHSSNYLNNPNAYICLSKHNQVLSKYFPYPNAYLCLSKQNQMLSKYFSHLSKAYPSLSEYSWHLSSVYLDNPHMEYVHIWTYSTLAIRQSSKNAFKWCPCCGFPKKEIAPSGIPIFGNSCSLLVTISSKTVQYLCWYWMFFWRIFWNIFPVCMSSHPSC